MGIVSCFGNDFLPNHLGRNYRCNWVCFQNKSAFTAAYRISKLVCMVSTVEPGYTGATEVEVRVKLDT